MAAPILMPTDTQILTLTQWLSPAFPVGSFAYSHGLEGAAGMGWVKDGAGLEAWLEDVLLHGAGRADSLLL
ncbi:MAG: urease accessory protein UreF, partial [Boseongicola sp. SB0667_bin_21]|nr:urease accessory protein UreF [Boseongicola sp. SB0667_bin_21]